MASLEGGEDCITSASGSQALFNLIFTIARPGDNVVTSLNVFGEGYKQAASIFPGRCGVTFRFVEDPTDPDSWDARIDRDTKLVWVETPSNPCLFVTDIAAVAELAHAQKVAEFLMTHPKVTHVNYSGLTGHPQHDLAERQMKTHGGMLSFVVTDGISGAARVMNSFKLIVHAVTFGTSRSICCTRRPSPTSI